MNAPFAPPALPPLTDRQRAVAERLTHLLTDLVTARRDQIDMVARLSCGDTRISPRSWLGRADEAWVRAASDAVYAAQDALDLALLKAMEAVGDDLDLVRGTNLGDADDMRGAVLSCVRHIQEPPEPFDDSLVSDFDFGRRRTA